MLYKFEHLNVLRDLKYVSSVLLVLFVFILGQLAESSDLQIRRIAHLRLALLPRGLLFFLLLLLYLLLTHLIDKVQRFLSLSI